jgi:hypothetical protein
MKPIMASCQAQMADAAKDYFIGKPVADQTCIVRIVARIIFRQALYTDLTIFGHMRVKDSSCLTLHRAFCDPQQQYYFVLK